MKYRGQWIFIPIAIASIVTSIALPVWGETVNTPIQGNRRFPVTSSTQPDQCGSANRQSEVVQVNVTEALASIDFVVTGNSGQPTLRVKNNRSGRETCVTADNLSGSQVEVSGAWEQGSYSVSVGDHNGQSHQFTLSVRQN